MSDLSELNFAVGFVIFLASVAGICVTGFLVSFIWRILLVFSGITSILLTSCGFFMILASEATTLPGIGLVAAGLVSFMAFVSVEGMDLDADYSSGSGFIFMFNIVLVGLVYDWYGYESIQFLIVTAGVFLTFVGEVITLSID